MSRRKGRNKPKGEGRKHTKKVETVADNKEESDDSENHKAAKTSNNASPGNNRKADEEVVGQVTGDIRKDSLKITTASQTISREHLGSPSACPHQEVKPIQIPLMSRTLFVLFHFLALELKAQPLICCSCALRRAWKIEGRWRWGSGVRGTKRRGRRASPGCVFS